jgi:CheY-like chemotaxis protein
VLAAADAETAWRAVQRYAGPKLLIVDVSLPPSGGLALVERCAALEVDRPSFIVTTLRHNAEDELRATRLGAIGYLTKPISYRDIASLLRSQQIDFVRAAPRVRGTPLTRAEACDQGDLAQLAWDVNDLSVSGAFLVTPAPLPVGTTLDLRVILGADAARVRAEVVRVQEPSWVHVGGVGVTFRSMEPTAYAKLERFVLA